ncbi:Formyl-coenzyme A transferase [Brevibacterium casei]|uniref:Formyl-coenzyme A transferase n=1 Tax=Brevibacterium casei TaxID=33889 RepID=A0A449CZU9_9MICO|nr:CoA transferase [Brevibacterium casei]VEW10722.1 Formyl-coenzyme A transferase [Brevibacterium casei]
MTTAATPAPAQAPLEGLRILDLSHFVAGPWCTVLLRELGAEVIKVEPPGGEISRNMGGVYAAGESAIFLGFNSGKKSVCIDLKTAEGRDAVVRMAHEADVVVQNFRPGTAERLGVGAEQLRKLRPELVYCAITAFGPDGPYAERPANDPLIQALSGAMWATTTPGGTPIRMGVSLPDFAAGVLAAIGILSAIRRKSSTGEGATVDINLLDSQLYAQTDLLAGGEFSPSVQKGSVRCSEGRYFWVEADGGDSACVPVQGLSEVLRNGTARTRSLEHPTVGELHQLKIPVDVDPPWPATASPPPLLGADTRDILGELGFSDRTIERLAAQGVINDDQIRTSNVNTTTPHNKEMP